MKQGVAHALLGGRGKREVAMLTHLLNKAGESLAGTLLLGVLVVGLQMCLEIAVVFLF
jgi:hypothetical protein